MVSVEKFNTVFTPAAVLTSAALSFHPEPAVSRTANLVCAAWVTTQIMKGVEGVLPKARAFAALAFAGAYVSPLIVGGAYVFSTLKEKISSKQPEAPVQETPAQQTPEQQLLSRLRARCAEFAQQSEDRFAARFPANERDHAREVYRQKLAEIQARDAARKEQPADADAAPDVQAADADAAGVDSEPAPAPIARKPRKSVDQQISEVGVEQRLTEQTARRLRSRDIDSPETAAVRRKRTSDVAISELGRRQRLDQREGYALRSRVRID